MPRDNDVRRIVAGARERGLPDDQIRALVARYDARQTETPAPATPPPPSATIGMLAPSTTQGDPRADLQHFQRPDMQLGEVAALMDSVDVMGAPLMPMGVAAGALRGAKSIPGIVSKGLGISKTAPPIASGSIQAAQPSRIEQLAEQASPAVRAALRGVLKAAGLVGSGTAAYHVFKD